MKREDVEFLAGIRSLTGIKIRLRPHEEIHTHQASDLQIMVSVRTFEVQETARETRFKKAGWKLYTLTRGSTDHMRWRLSDVTTIWDSSFEPYVLRHYGRTDTPQEARERREWADLCYRPGTDRFPLENLAVTEGRVMDNDVSPKMRRHWNV